MVLLRVNIPIMHTFVLVITELANFYSLIQSFGTIS